MPGMPAKLVLASAASLLLAAPAFAGGYYDGGYGCNCAPQPQVRVVEGVAPVTYYVPRTVIVPQQVYVRRQVLVPQRAYVRTRSYVVDQGPTYDLPPVRYRAATVNYAPGDVYPYARSPRLYYGYGYGRYYGYGYRHRGYHRRAFARYGYGYQGYRYGYGHRYGRGWRGGYAPRPAYRAARYHTHMMGGRYGGPRAGGLVGGPRMHAPAMRAGRRR